MIKKTPQEIWAEHQKCIEYNNYIELYDTVKENQNFFINKQWEGVCAPDLDKPVFNILKRIANLFVAMIVSDDISISLSAFNGREIPKLNVLFKVVEKEIEFIQEYAKVKTKNREILKNAAIDGDGCYYIYFDADEDIGQTAKGIIKFDVIDNINIEFANPICADVQAQPYIIIPIRETLEAVQKIANDNGIPQDKIAEIKTDSDDRAEYYNAPQMVTVLIKMWKENGTVRCIKTTQDVIIKEEFDTKYMLYPVAYISWEKVKNSYHGQALLTGLLPNQMFINKLYAMAMKYETDMAFPKKLYNINTIDEITNEVGAIGIDVDEGIDLRSQIVTESPSNMSPQVMQLIERVITDTKEWMGATNASLGNIRPDNKSAIIAVQQSAAVPLQLQEMAFYQFVEDYIRIIIDIMSVDYGKREVTFTDNGETVTGTFDFSQLKETKLKLNVDIGASSYYSEIDQTITMDNLFNKDIIDVETYVESIPEKRLNNKQKILDKLKERRAANSLVVTPGDNMDTLPPQGGFSMPEGGEIL